MIVVEMKLVSAISADRDEDLGTLILDNITTREKFRDSHGRRGDYRARMYRKGALTKSEGDPRKMSVVNTPTREATVLDHQRLAEPVHNLVAKALVALGYDAECPAA